MKVKMTKSFATREKGYARDSEYDLEDGLAKAFVNDGLAEPVEAPKPKRTTRKGKATAPKPETRAKRSQKAG